MRKLAAVVAVFFAMAVSGCTQGEKLDQMYQFDGAVFSISSDWETEEDISDASNILWIRGDGFFMTLQANPDDSLYNDADDFKYSMRESFGMDAKFEETRKEDQTLIVCEWTREDGQRELIAAVLEDNGGFAQVFCTGVCDDPSTESSVRAMFDTIEIA